MLFKIDINDEGDNIIYNHITERWILNSFNNRRSIFKQIKNHINMFDEAVSSLTKGITDPKTIKNNREFIEMVKTDKINFKNLYNI